MSEMNQHQGNHHQSTQLNPNDDPLVPRQQQHDPVPFQLLAGPSQQLNPQDNQFPTRRGYNPTQFPKHNFGPQNAQQNQYSKLAQTNSDLVIPGEMF